MDSSTLDDLEFFEEDPANKFSSTLATLHMDPAAVSKHTEQMLHFESSFDNVEEVLDRNAQFCKTQGIDPAPTRKTDPQLIAAACRRGFNITGAGQLVDENVMAELTNIAQTVLDSRNPQHRVEVGREAMDPQLVMTMFKELMEEQRKIAEKQQKDMIAMVMSQMAGTSRVKTEPEEVSV
ncbi:unnamed protein product, partial [Heligmosomoides polygyrus]|uniref:STI1 domain-containing protein n=1 Tax=Heligmosomoides polygyrus TaxID=6339 RepID=A0A183FR82_HELPZ